jgi:hypothetical protein
MQNSILETSLVVDYMTEIWIWNFKISVRSLTTFPWITLKFQVFSQDMYTFFESLGCQLTENNNKTWNFQQFRKFKLIYCNSSIFRVWSSLDAKVYAEFRKKIMFYKFLNWKKNPIFRICAIRMDLRKNYGLCPISSRNRISFR